MSRQVVLITGALTGIGRATAIAFAREGSAIVIAGRREELGRTIVDELRALGSDSEFVQTDVRDETQIQHLLEVTLERFGRLDVAVNNAGTEGQPGPIIEQTVATYQATFDTNVLGTLLSMKHEIHAMLPQLKGSIINISSTYGKLGGPYVSLYSASKHAVEGLTKSAALELADSGIRVNLVAPGPIETDMLNRLTQNEEKKAGLLTRVPLKRVGLPEEVAQAIVFLASEKAAFITGTSIAVDGGKSAG